MIWNAAVGCSNADQWSQDWAGRHAVSREDGMDAGVGRDRDSNVVLLRVLSHSVTAVSLLPRSRRVSFICDASDVCLGVSICIFGRDGRLFCFRGCLWLLLSNLGWCWYRTLGPGCEFIHVLSISLFTALHCTVYLATSNAIINHKYTVTSRTRSALELSGRYCQIGNAVTQHVLWNIVFIFMKRFFSAQCGIQLCKKQLSFLLCLASVLFSLFPLPSPHVPIMFSSFRIPFR